MNEEVIKALTDLGIMGDIKIELYGNAHNDTYFAMLLDFFSAEPIARASSDNVIDAIINLRDSAVKHLQEEFSTMEQ